MVLLRSRKLAHLLQHLHHADAQAQGLLAGFLDHRAIGHGVVKRHAQLDDVGTGFDHAVHQRRG